MVDGTRPRKSHTFFSVYCALFFRAIFQLRTDRRFSSHHLAPETQNEAVQVFVIRRAQAKSFQTSIQNGDHQRLEKRRRTRSVTPSRNHTGRNLVQVRDAAARSNAAHDVEVRTKVPSNRSCRARKHSRAVKEGHILRGTLACKRRHSVLVSLCFVPSPPAHCPGQHCPPSLVTMCGPAPW